MERLIDLMMGATSVKWKVMINNAVSGSGLRKRGKSS